MTSATISTREAARRKLVWLITFIYLVLIFEGVLRKWLFPSASQALFFIRDPFVLVAYWLALRHDFFEPRGLVFKASIGFGVLGILLGAIQLLSIGAGVQGLLLLEGYGWRNYFFYIPLAFVIGATFQRADLERIVKITLLIAIPMSALAFLQYVSPLNSPINVGIASDSAAQFHGLTVDKDHTRPMGTFTSNVGQKQFITSALAMVLGLWIAPAARRFVKLWLLIPATGAVLACLAVSGSRGAMLHCGIVLIAAIFCAAVIRKGGISVRALVLPVVIGVAAVMLYPILFPDSYASFMWRWDAAAVSETRYFKWGVVGRALYGFVEFIGLMGDTPLAGYGLGVAGNASIMLGVQNITGFTGWAEADWSRHIVDLGPVVGVLFIGYRVLFTSWLGLRSLAGSRRQADPLAVMLFAYVSFELLTGQVTGHGSVNGYVWLFTGFCFAAFARSTVKAESASPAAVPAPRFANLMR